MTHINNSNVTVFEDAMLCWSLVISNLSLQPQLSIWSVEEWRWRSQLPPKHWSVAIRLQGVTCFNDTTLEIQIS